MKKHHTKNKGDIGVARVVADLYEQGFVCFTSFSEHQDFDLVAYRTGGKFIRIQVKYRTAKDGVINVCFRSSWTDKNGTHTQMANKDEIDVFAVYCPNTNSCYYLNCNKSNTQQSIVLRITPSKNKQVKGVKLADDYKWVP